MNKTAIKNFAVRARNRLIEDITQKAYELGITKGEIKEIETFEGGFKIKDFENSKTYKKYEIKQREKLVSNIKEKGFDQTIEEVAYTWFNRFVALRFMEVNEYLPAGVRVLSSLEQGKTEPDIIKEALNIDFDLNPKEYEEYKEIVYRLMDANDTEDLYRYLIVKQCNQLGSIMPMVFEEISDYTELLLPNNLLAEDSIVRDLVESIEEDDYKDQVEIMGWMYQYYISEKKDEVFADLKKNKKITKENIPAATQLFTPKWIVKYMVENSLGRLWLESHPDEELQSQWKYYLEEAQQDPEVQKKLDELKDPNLNPENIKVLDPSMGSGHILVYAFDVLYDIYVKAGYSERDIPQLILENNLYGLDIDDRAGQLAAFALMMKARSKSRRIFRRKIDLNICSIQESNGISEEALDFFANGDKKIKEDIQYLVEVFHDAKEYGSILDVKKVDFDAIERNIEELKNQQADLVELQYKGLLLEKLPPLVKQGRIMSQKYDVICTNPPYMGSDSMGSKLKTYVAKYYKNERYDIYSIFIAKCLQMRNKNGFVAMITQHSYMFALCFSNFRDSLLRETSIVNAVHLGSHAFGDISGEVVQTIATVFSKHIEKQKSKFIRLVEYKENKEQAFWFENPYVVDSEIFTLLPNNVFAYSLSPVMKSLITNEKKMGDKFTSKAGVVTGNDKYFLRYWQEVSFPELDLNATGIASKYVPFSKGGSFVKWYGNIIYAIKLQDLWTESKVNKSVHRGDKTAYFKQSIGWSYMGGGNKKNFSILRGCVCGTGTPTILNSSEREFFYTLGFLNTKIPQKFIELFNPTLNTYASDICNLPYVESIKSESVVDKVRECIHIAKTDWDSFETSWDFKHHPLLTYSSMKNNDNSNKIETAFNQWSDFTNEQFVKLKANEEELNRIFIDIYGLQDELTPEVDDKDITIARVYNSKQDIPESMKGNNYILTREDVIKSFISYAVGCMFGRYSLDEEGLIYAGGEFDLNRYETFIPTKDNVLVIADDDYFEDDIVNRFVDFVKVTFGEKTLEENLDYIAETLGQKASETSRQTIGRYFLKNFYKDHIKTYQKRPIYWLFDSGKKNGFKALIYMHRYDSSTVARVRTDYLHKLQKMYEAEVKRLDILLESDLSAREKAAAKKKKDSINKQIQECMTYDQVVAHIANQKIEIDLDDGVKVNYAKFQGVEVPQGEGKKPLKANLLAKI